MQDPGHRQDRDRRRHIRHNDESLAQNILGNMSFILWMSLEGFLSIIVSWPTFAILALIILRDSIRKVLNGIVEFEILGIRFRKLAEQGERTITNAERINVLIAESRIIETKIFLREFRDRLTEERRQELEMNLDELEKITKKQSQI